MNLTQYPMATATTTPIRQCTTDYFSSEFRIYLEIYSDGLLNLLQLRSVPKETRKIYTFSKIKPTTATEQKKNQKQKQKQKNKKNNNNKMEIGHFTLLICKGRPRNVLRLILFILFGDVLDAVAVAFCVRFLRNANRAITQQEHREPSHLVRI